MYVPDASFNKVSTPFDHPECELNLARGFDTLAGCYHLWILTEVKTFLRLSNGITSQ